MKKKDELYFHYDISLNKENTMVIGKFEINTKNNIEDITSYMELIGSIVQERIEFANNEKEKKEKTK